MHMVGKVEAALEGAGRNAAMQEHAGFVFGGLAARDEEGVLADLDGEVFVGKAGNGAR